MVYQARHWEGQMQPRPDYLLTLRCRFIDPNDPAAVAGLRRLLKTLLRRYGLRCVDAREVPADAKVDGKDAG
jgi:hypothetical protein